MVNPTGWVRQALVLVYSAAPEQAQAGGGGGIDGEGPLYAILAVLGTIIVMSILVVALGLLVLRGQEKPKMLERAQRALDKWKPSGAIKVHKVHVVKQYNMARADITMNNVEVGGSGKLSHYFGPGEAEFVSPSEGRWLLVRVQTSRGPDPTIWDNLQVEAD